MAWGALQVRDSLQSLRIAAGTIASYGEDRTWEAVEAARKAHNEIVAELMSTFVSVTTQRQERVGLPDSTDMEELAEYGTTEAQKIAPGPLVGIPIRRYGRGLAWNRDYMRRTKTSEFAAQITEIFAADLRRIQRQIKRAIFFSTNYTWTDVLIDNASLAVKALANNDGMVPPLGPNGESFAGTHNHYLGTGSFVVGDLDTLINHVAEHAYGGEMYLAINKAQEATIRGFTGFTPYVDVRAIQSQTTVYSKTKALDVISINNRPIGIYAGAEVWVKPWAIANYVVAWVNDPQQRKALAMRIMGDGPEGIGGGSGSIISGGRDGGPGDLELVYDDEDYPMRCREYVREFDIAPVNRVLAAVLYISNATYANPTIA